MADETEEDSIWMPVIGKALAYLALSKAKEAEPDKFKDLLTRVGFLEGLGLPTKDASVAAGSTAASVSELRRQRRNKSSGKKSKASPRKR